MGFNSGFKVLMVLNGTFLKLVPLYTFSILDTCHPDILYLHEQGVRIRGYFSKPRGVCEQKRLRNAGFVCGCASFWLLVLSV